MQTIEETIKKLEESHASILDNVGYMFFYKHDDQVIREKCTDMIQILQEILDEEF